MSGWKVWLVLAAALMVAAVSACSSSSSTVGTSSTVGSSPSSGASSSASSGGNAAAGAPINVGLICSCNNAVFGSTATNESDGAKASIDAINAAGGVNGHKINIIQQNDNGNPATSVTAVQALVSDHVAAILDWSFVDAAWASTIGKSGIPVVGGNINGPAFNTYADFYPQGQTQDSVSESSASTSKATGAKSLGILYCTEAPTCISSAASIKSEAQADGLPVSYDAQATSVEPNYTAQCLAAKQAGAGALFLLYAPAAAQVIATDCARQGYNPKYVMEGGAISFHIAQSSTGLKTYLAGPFANRPSIDTANPGVQAMNTAIQKYFPGLEDQTAWTELSASGWAEGLLLEAALKDGGLTASTSATPALIVKGLDSMKGETLGGMAPPLTFTPGKPTSIDCWFTASMVNGTAQMTNGGNTTCAK
ncbi:MAG: ABC transporter substrate-binding protein [Trebonia sp.]